MEYNFSDIEKKWRQYWAENKTFRALNPGESKVFQHGEDLGGAPKYYALDMFPYPSGAGLHVGHPLGYIASDIVSRYKRHKGFNVLHPMGYDSFGLPAEQYAIQTGQHPAITTENNIKRYREQLDKIGFSFDWDREVRTSDPGFYKWTQWIFIKLFNSWYNPETNKAESIEMLVSKFETQNPQFEVAGQKKNWTILNEKERSDILMNYRLAYLSEAMVNWCPALGTVLANEEVKDGVSERGGYPVERKLMPQWSLRITAYADRLLNDLDLIDWSESLKESQRNWIGKSEGSSLKFAIHNSQFAIEVFTTRPDTVFGATFVTLAPEHELIEKITTAENKKAVDEYVTAAKNRSERERMAEVKKVTGEFTGAYAVHPFSGNKIPIWTGDYVLAGYGTGAVMGVPAHDSRDFAFAKHFGLDIIKVIEPNNPIPIGEGQGGAECFDTYDGHCINSDFINGLQVKDAIKKIISEIEKRNLGKGKTNYRLRDAIFGRQRYWGEPIPIYYKDGIPHAVDEKDLPVVLPEVDKYLPTETGEPPLARAKDWRYKPLSSSPQRGEGFKWQTAAPSSWPETKIRSNELRNDQTKAEQILWQHLKAKKLDDKFRRQHVIGNYIVDFVCLDKMLIIEVDGKIHDAQKEYDIARTKDLESVGFSVLRFSNEEVFGNIDAVVEKIKKELSEKVLPLGEDLGGTYPLETTTMPGWAGSSWYYLRYMDANSENEFASKEAVNYWKDVDLYIGGSEHATGHLLYVRFWTKFLFDLGYIPVIEPAKKLINQGMIQGRSSFVYRVQLMVISRLHNQEEQAEFFNIFQSEIPNVFVSANLIKMDASEDMIKSILEDIILDYFDPATITISSDTLKLKRVSRLHVDVAFVHNDVLDIEALRKSNDSFKDSVFILEDISTGLPAHEKYGGRYICDWEIEKMSKSKLNVETPDDICDKYGADCLRMYEMFLGPLEQSKPWNTNGITGVFNFLRKFWRLYHQNDTLSPSLKEKGSGDESFKVLHRTIKKVTEDIERYSFNTSISTFMICVNELTDLKCGKEILEKLCILISPFAPHIAEELWEKLGHRESIAYAPWPLHDEKYLVENSFEYPVSVNGKTRFKIPLSLQLTKEQVEKEVLSAEELKKYTSGNTPKKVIVVPGRIVNVVV